MRLRELAERINSLVVQGYGEMPVIDEDGSDVVHVMGPVDKTEMSTQEDTIMLVLHVDLDLREALAKEGNHYGA